jgi:FkbM family methyltransferase
LAAETVPTTIFDVGANLGPSVDIFQRVFPEAFIYAFEPLHERFAALAEKMCPFHPKVQTFNIGFAEEKKQQKLFTSRHSVLNSLLPPTPQWPWQNSPAVEGENASFTTLDDFVEEGQVPHIHLLKIDTQGAESLVLRGAQKCLREERISIIKSEINHGRGPFCAGQSRLSELSGLLEDSRFQLLGMYERFYDNWGRLLWSDFVYVHENLFKPFPAS